MFRRMLLLLLGFVGEREKEDARVFLKQKTNVNLPILGLQRVRESPFAQDWEGIGLRKRKKEMS